MRRYYKEESLYRIAEDKFLDSHMLIYWMRQRYEMGILMDDEVIEMVDDTDVKEYLQTSPQVFSRWEAYKFRQLA
jgi:hypothetical protein